MHLDNLKGKKILVVGMAGSGKTFVSEFIQAQGINAFDGDNVKNFSAWVNQKGEKILPKDLSIESLAGLEWNWNPEVLNNLVKENADGFLLFGVSSNWYKFLDLFDKVFFLYLGAEETRTRLTSKERKNTYARGEDEIQNVLKHIEGFRKFALQHRAIQLDASKSPKEIYLEIINKI